MPNEKTFESLQEIMDLNHEAGRFFFSPSTLGFFNSKIHCGPFRGKYFVTSEKDGSKPRRYTVRIALPDGTIETAGDFQGHGTLASAKASARGEA